MAYLSPPVVYVGPYHHRRGYYGGYGPYGNNAESAENEETYENDSGDENDQQPSITESQVNQEYIAARDAHPLAKQHSEFTKVHCDSCGGFTMLKDGEVDELQHKEFCKEGKKLEVEATNCHNKKKTHVVTKHKTMPPPEEEEEESSTEEDSDEEEETEEKEGDIIEIYLEDADKIAQNIEKSYNENKPFRGSFNKKIDALDGTGVMDVKVTLSTSAKNSKGVAALQFVLTPMENGKAVKDSSISATLWHLNLDSKKSEKRIAFQKDQAKVFKDANVQHQVLLETTAHVDAALSKLMKK